MMKLNLMKTIVSTITDTGNSSLANQLLTAWSHDPGTVRFFRTGANAVFTFTQARRLYILRFNHDCERTIDAIRAEVDYLQYLSAKAIAIAQPVQSRAGNYVESMNTPYGRFHSVVFEAITGYRFDIEDLTLDRFSQWGQMLGKLHAATQSYPGVGRLIWHDYLTRLVDHIPACEQAAHEAIAKLCTRLNALPITAETFGLIHFDFELDNLIWTDQGPTAIDFDDSIWCWFAADIAFALRDLFDDDVTHINTSRASFQAFIAGYRTEQVITEAAIALLPLFLRLHHVITFAKLLRALEPKHQTHEPTWAKILRQKLEKKAQDYRDEFTAYTR